MATGLSKPALARHLTTWHGNSRSLVPLAELRRWTRNELTAEHDRLIDIGGQCPFGSLADRIVKKKAALR
jgi:hypothetical protein